MLRAKTTSSQIVIAEAEIPPLLGLQDASDGGTSADFTLLIAFFIPQGGLPGANQDFFRVGSTTRSLYLRIRSTDAFQLVVDGDDGGVTFVNFPSIVIRDDSEGNWNIGAITWAAATHDVTLRHISELAGITSSTQNLGIDIDNAVGNMEIGIGQSGAALSGIPYAIAVRDHVITDADFLEIAHTSGSGVLGASSTPKWSNIFSLDNTASGGNMTGRAGLKWAIGHAFFDIESGGATAALLGEDAATTNTVVCGTTGTFTDDWQDIGTFTSMTSGANAFTHESPHDVNAAWGSFFARARYNRAGAISVRGSGYLATIWAKGQQPPGQYRLTLHGPSLVSWGSDANAARWAGNLGNGLVVADPTHVIGFDNAPIVTSARRWFGADQTGNAVTSGTISGMTAASGPGIGLNSFYMVGGSGAGGGVMIEPNSSIDVRFKAEGIEDVPPWCGATKLNREAATQRIGFIKGPFCASGGTITVLVQSHVSSSSNAAASGLATSGTIDLHSDAIFDTDTDFTSANGDEYDSTARTVTFAGHDHYNDIAVGDLCYLDPVSADSVDRNLTIVEAVRLSNDGDDTIVAFQQAFYDPAGSIITSLADGDVLRFGDGGPVFFTHHHAAVSGSNIYRGLTLTLSVAQDGPAFTLVQGAWNSTAYGWIVCPIGRGSNELTDQLDGGGGQRPLLIDGKYPWLDSMQPDLALIDAEPSTSADEFHNTGDMTDAIRAIGRDPSVVWFDPPAGSDNSLWQGTSQFASSNAASYKVPCAIVSGKAAWGTWEEGSADGYFTDGRHLSLRGNAAYISLIQTELLTYAVVHDVVLPPSLQPVLDEIQKRLEGDGNLKTLVGRRIYHASFPEDSALPLVVYQMADTPQERFFDNAITYPIELDVDVMFGSAETGNQAMVAAGKAEDRIAALLDRHEFSPPTGYSRMKSIVINRGQRIRDFDLIRTSTRVRVYAQTNGS